MPNESPRIPITVIDSISQRSTAASKPLNLPTDIESSVVAAATARVFGHVTVDNNGHPYNYRFRRENQKMIGPSETLAQAKLKPASTLYLTYEPQAASHI